MGSDDQCCWFGMQGHLPSPYIPPILCKIPSSVFFSMKMSVFSVINENRFEIMINLSTLN